MSLKEMAKQKTLSTEEKCIAYLEKMRWPEGVRCPVCGNSSISSFQAKGKSGKIRHLYQCLDKGCRYQFSPTTGTIFHDSHLPLNKWFSAIALVCDAEKPMSANQLRLALGVQYKTATHLVGRIRQAMENGTIELSRESTEAQAGVFAANSALETSKGQKISPESGGYASLPGARPRPAIARDPLSKILEERRAETANLLNHISPKPSTETISGTAVDNMLSMFVSLAQMSVRPPLFFVNYLRDKVFT